MRRGAPALAALALLAGAVVAARAALGSDLARSFTLALPGAHLAVRVPRTFAPLLPGSVYPDRARPVPPRHLPVALVETSGGIARKMRAELLARGFLIVEIPPGWKERTGEVLDAVARRPEADAARAVFAGAGRLPAPLDVRIRSALLFDPEWAGSRAARPGKGFPVAAFLRTPRLSPSGSLTARLEGLLGSRLSERWYRSERGFPPEAFRDAAEWLNASLPGR